jgi:hypothetical protein
MKATFHHRSSRMKDKGEFLASVIFCRRLSRQENMKVEMENDFNKLIRYTYRLDPVSFNF